MPLTIKSKLLEKKSFAGMPSAGTDVALMDIATNLLIFSTIITKDGTASLNYIWLKNMHPG